MELFNETQIAELLDALLHARREFDQAPDLGSDQPLIDRLNQLEAGLAELETSSPAGLLAKLICVSAVCCDNMFSRKGSVHWLDFENALEATDCNQDELLARVVIAMEQNCAGSPVAEVIAKHRDLARRDAEFCEACDTALEPFEAAAAAAEDKQALELQKACEAMRQVMDENRRLKESPPIGNAGTA